MEEKGSKTNPYHISLLLDTLSEDTGIARRYKVALDKLRDYKSQPNVKLSNLYVVLDGIEYMVGGSYTAKGAVQMIKIYNTDDRKEVPMNDTEFDEVFFYRYNKLEDFSEVADVEKAGKYNVSEGGGWYTKTQLYKYKDNYYCNLT